MEFADTYYIFYLFFVIFDNQLSQYLHFNIISAFSFRVFSYFSIYFYASQLNVHDWPVLHQIKSHPVSVETQ